MNWLALIIAFAVGAMAAAAANARWQRERPGWSKLRRVFFAAALVPLAILVLVIIGNAWAYLALPEGGEGGREITVFVFTVVGIVVAVPAMIGGLVGAGLAERKSRP